MRGGRDGYPVTNLVLWTNMVLSAILPEFSDAAAKLKLPVPIPITQADVTRFHCSQIEKHLSVKVWLRSGPSLWYAYGGVTAVELPSAYYKLQDPRDIPKFFGTPKLGEAECLEIALKAVEALGYTNVLRGLPPTNVEKGPELDGQKVPRYNFHWRDTIDDGRVITADVEVDSEKGAVKDLFLVGRAFRRPEPAVAKLRAPPRPLGKKENLPPEAELLPPAHQTRMLQVIWPQVVEFLERIGQPKPAGGVEQELNLERTKCFRFHGSLNSVMVTRKGELICYQRGQIFRYDAPDAYTSERYLLETKLDRDDFVTQWVYTDEELTSRIGRLLVDQLKLDKVRFGLGPNWVLRMSDKRIRGQPAHRRVVWDYGPPRTEEQVNEELQGLFRPFWARVEADSVTGELKCLILEVSRLDPKPEPDLGPIASDLKPEPTEDKAKQKGETLNAK